MSSSRIVSLESDDGQRILVEVEDRTLEGPRPVGALDQIGGLSALGATIRSFSRLVLQSLEHLGHEKRVPEKVAVEFGVKFVGEAAIPTIAKGSAESNVSITIEWKTNSGDA